MTEENKNIETNTKSANTETHTTTASTKPSKRLKRKMNTNRPVYLYDFNGNFVGRFRGPTDAAKQYDFDGNLIRVFKNASDAAENLGKSTAWVSILCNADFILRYDR